MANLAFVEQEYEVARSQRKRRDEPGGPGDMRTRPHGSAGADNRENAHAEPRCLQILERGLKVGVIPALAAVGPDRRVARPDTQTYSDQSQRGVGGPRCSARSGGA